MTEEPEEEGDEFDGEILISAFKSLLDAIGPAGTKFAMWTSDPRLEHMNLHARGYPEHGIWIFSLSHKSEEQEQGAGHA